MSAAVPERSFHRYPDKTFEVGLAEDEMGPAIGTFLNENGIDFGGHHLQWDRVYPYWAIAIAEDGDILGVTNIVHSIPVGRLELLCYKKGIEKGLQVQVHHELVILGMAALTANGSELLAGTISGSQEVYLNWWKRRGATTAMTDGHILLMRFPNG